MTRVQREWIRGAGPLAVLTLLADRDMYGYELAESIDRQSNGVLSMGHSTLYSLLYNLEGKGLIEPGRRKAGKGRPRKYYRVTDAGRKWLEQHRREWSELVNAMAGLGLA